MRNRDDEGGILPNQLWLGSTKGLSISGAFLRQVSILDISTDELVFLISAEKKKKCKNSVFIKNHAIFIV